MAEKLSDAIRRWRKDAIAFVREEFKAEPDAWQKDVLKAWVSDDPKKTRIAMQACAGPGKSAVLAWCAWHFLVCQGEIGHHPQGFAVSITADNLRDGLWKELAHWRNRSPMLQAVFEWQKEQIFARHHPETWWLRARTFSKSADPEAQGRTLSGLHSKYIAYFIDESGDMPPSVGRSAEQGLGGEEIVFGKSAQAGNPTSLVGMLHHAAVEQAHLHHVVRITGDPLDPKRSPRISLTWAEEQIEIYGRDNPWVMAFILGLFPPAAFNSLLSPDEVREAMARPLKLQDYELLQKRIGADVARFGDDPTILFPRQGRRAFKPVEMRGARTDAIAARIMVGKSKFKSEMEMIDDTGGWAAGVIDSCRLAGVELFPVNFSGKALDERYFNKRSEIWFKMADWIKSGGSLPDTPELVAELTVPTYTFQNGKLRLEEKDQIKARLGRSPNYADALAVTFALPDMPGNMGLPQHLFGDGVGKMASEYDPMAAA